MRRYEKMCPNDFVVASILGCHFNVLDLLLWPLFTVMSKLFQCSYFFILSVLLFSIYLFNLCCFLVTVDSSSSQLNTLLTQMSFFSSFQINNSHFVNLT